MKKQICIVCVLCATSSWLLGMEQQQPRPAIVTHEVARAQQQDIIKIISSHGGKEYELNKHAAALSQMLRSMLEIVEQDANTPIELDFADNQIAFIAAALTYLSRTSLESQTKEQLAEIIMGVGRQFGLSFFDMLHLVNYFDIPLAFNALTSIQRLPLPSPIAAVEYNKALAIVFDMAISTASTSRPSDDSVTDALLPQQQRLNRIGSVQLWQLFGRMLYPNCMRYAEVQRMFDAIKARFDEKVANLLLHEIMLGEYMQQHPELYGNPLQSLAGHRSTINSVVFSPDGKLIASGSGDIYSASNDGAINLWIVGESSRTSIQASGSSVNTLAFSPDSTLIASGSNNGHIDIWGIDGSLQRTFQFSPYAVYSVAFSPDGTMLVSGSGNSEVVLWNTRTGLPIRKFENNKDLHGVAFSVAFSPDGQSVAASSCTGIQLWSVADGSQKGQLGGGENPFYCFFSIAYSPDGSMIVAGRGNEKVQLWHVANKKLLHTFDVHVADIALGESQGSVALSPDGRAIISGANGEDIKVLSVANKKLVRRIGIGHNGRVYTVAASPNGTMIVSGSGFRGRELWELTGLCLVQLWGYRDLFEALQAPLAASSYTYARKRMAPAVQAPVVVAAPSPSMPVQPKSLLAPGFLEKAFPHTERRTVEAQEASDDDEPVVLPAPLPEEKK